MRCNPSGQDPLQSSFTALRTCPVTIPVGIIDTLRGETDIAAPFPQHMGGEWVRFGAIFPFVFRDLGLLTPFAGYHVRFDESL